jgi:hypothetical protein
MLPEWLSPAESSGRFVWGFFGALAPEAMRLHRIVTGASRQALPTFDFPYFAISAPNCLVEGFATIAIGGDTPWNCVVVGAFWPLALTAGARQFQR